MPKKIDRPSSRHVVLIYDEDWDYLESRYGFGGIKPVGVNAVIRALIHAKVQMMRAAEAEVRDLSLSEEVV